jgi:hypothetical protein
MAPKKKNPPKKKKGGGGDVGALLSAVGVEDAATALAAATNLVEEFKIIKKTYHVSPPSPHPHLSPSSGRNFYRVRPLAFPRQSPAASAVPRVPTSR